MGKKIGEVVNPKTITKGGSSKPENDNAHNVKKNDNMECSKIGG